MMQLHKNAIFFKESKNKTGRILIDCFNTFQGNLNTGIQRAVRNIIVRSKRISDKLGISIIPIILGMRDYISLE